MFSKYDMAMWTNAFPKQWLFTLESGQLLNEIRLQLIYSAMWGLRVVIGSMWTAEPSEFCSHAHPFSSWRMVKPARYSTAAIQSEAKPLQRPWVHWSSINRCSSMIWSQIFCYPPSKVDFQPLCYLLFQKKKVHMMVWSACPHRFQLALSQRYCAQIR